jgi:hypothetical protein
MRRLTHHRNVVALVGEHLPQISDIGGGLIGRQVGARALFVKQRLPV